jgi:hypothetical protein
VAARKTPQPPADFEPARGETARGLDETVPLPAKRQTPDPAGGMWLFPAVILFAVWVAFLVTLAVLSSNPVTLNRAQIRRADLVVEATVQQLATGECRIERSWPDAPQLGPVITVADLEEAGAHAGQAYLLPLEREPRRAGFRIAPTPPPLSKPLIYPANVDSRHQLEEILAQPPTTAPASGE